MCVAVFAVALRRWLALQTFHILQYNTSETLTTKSGVEVKSQKSLGNFFYKKLLVYIKIFLGDNNHFKSNLETEAWVCNRILLLSI